MQDNTYDLEREIIEEENDHEIGDYNNSNPRPFTTDQGPNGKRPKVKTNNFYGFPSAGAFPIVYPNTRPFSEKLSKPSGRPMAQNTSFKSHDRSSHINPKDLELEQTNRNLQSPKKYLAVPVSGSQKNYKIIPKNIPQDKERLYDETLNLKNLVHSLKDENLRLKTKVNIMEKEALKFERMMADQDGGALERELVPKPSEGHLVVGLKNRLIEVENALQEKETELAKLKKNVRVTKMAELEVQLKLFTEESYRLKGVLDQLLKEKSQNMMRQEGRNRLQEECLLQAAQIKAMEKDHEQLVKIVKAFEQQSADYEKKLTEAKKEKKIETQKLKKLVAEKEKENMKLKQELETANSNLSSGPTYAGKRPFGNREEFSILELEKKKSENLNLLEQLNEKNTQIQQLEKKLKEATKLSLSPEKATGSRRPSNKLNIPVESVHQPLVKAPTQSEKEKRTDAVFILQDEDDMSEEEGSVADHEESGRVISVPRKRVQKVSADDVKELGYEINLSLRAKGKSFDDVNKVIWPESAVQRDRISVKEVIQILRRDPISMKNEEDAILIARYLVEENQAEYLYYNEDVEGDLVIAKSILRKLIGSVPNWSQQTLQSLHDSVSEICTKHHLSLRENLRVSCKDGNLNKKALKEVCKLIEVAVSDDQIEFIITKLFEKSHNVHALAIENLFEIFFRPPKESDLSRNGSMQEQTVPVPPVARKSVDLVSEFKPKKELVIPEPKNQEVHNYTTESPLKIKTPSQGTASQNDVKENKSRVSEEARVLAEVKQPSSRGQKSSARDESRSYEDDAQVEQNRKEAEPNQSEQREEEYQFEEEERSQGEQEYEQEQEEEQEEEEERHNEEQAQESGRAESIEMPESRRLESMVTNHTNTTQFTEPKSDILGVTNRAQEERKDEASERLNSISEKDENVESRREQTAGERKVTKEQEDEEKEYKEEFQEEVEEEEAEKEEKTVSHRKEEKPEKVESGDEYENEEAFEEIDDDS